MPKKSAYTPENIKCIAPPHPYWFYCPECDTEEYKVKAWLKFHYSTTETWGTVQTRHDFYRCPNCKDTFVSTNGREPELAADEYRIGRRQ